MTRWPFATRAPGTGVGRFWGMADMAGPAVGSTRSQMTHNVTSWLLIDALRKVHSIALSARATRSAGTLEVPSGSAGHNRTALLEP